MAASELTIQDIQDVTVVDFRQAAILDTAVIDAISRELYALIDERAVRKLVLDFTNVRFLSSQALGILIVLKRKSDAIEGQVALCGLKGELQRIFKIMNLQKVFKFYDNEQDALGAFDVFTA